MTPDPSKSPLERLIAEIHRRSLWQVLSVYVVAAWVALQLVDVLANNFGLPAWFPAFALALLILGLPMVLATAFVQRAGPERGSDRDGTPELENIFQEVEEARGAENGAPSTLFTWRNAIAGGVVAFALWGVAAAGWILLDGASQQTEADASSTRPSLAVLPFDNLSTDESNAYFAAGIHEEILTQLSRAGGIKLISRTSVLRYEDREKSLSQIARELGVSRVLEGSVQRSGDRVRISTQLIDAEADEHLWAERYDRELSDIFQIQTDVATRIVEELRGVLTPEERAELARKPTDNVDSYAHYLRGHEHFRNLFSEEDAREAASAYQRAVELDSTFSAAWARLVQARLWLAWNYGAYDERGRARAALDRLEELAPGSPQLRLARGLWLYYGVQHYEEALEEFDALARLWPEDVDVIRYRAALYRRLGRWEEAVRTMGEVVEQDPADAAFALTVAQTYRMMRRFEQAEHYARMAVSLDPSVPSHWGSLLQLSLARGDTAEYRIVLDSAATHLDPASIAIRRVRLLIHTGREEQALRQLLDLNDGGTVGPRAMLRVAAAAGRTDLAAAWADSIRIRAERALEGVPVDDRATRSGWLADLAIAHAYLGNDSEAVRIADEAVALLPVSHDAFYGPRRVFDQARVYTVVGRHDEAVELLRHLLSIPAEDVTVPLLRMRPIWDPLRQHPGFRALVEPPLAGSDPPR